VFGWICLLLGAVAGWSAPGLAARAVAAPPPGRGCRPERLVAAPLTAAACGILAVAAGPAPATVALLALGLLAPALVLADLRHLRLPQPLLLAGLLAVGASLAVAAGSDRPAATRALAGAAALGGAHLALALLPGAGLGLGDVKLAALLGAPLAWLGWDALAVGLLLPHLLAGPPALALLRSGRRTPLPFGPALLAGALGAVAAHRAGW
jgi:leader peptidase (prepilin peptidase)/N-methyltransferase